MDSKKLDKWVDLLLDTGKRNNLINFKNTKISTVEVLYPPADVVFERIEDSSSFEVFDPKITEEDDETETISEIKIQQDEVQKEHDVSNEKNAFLAKYSGKIKRRNQILLYGSTANPIVAVKNIDKRARAFIEETGVNVAYMVFGFIYWKERGDTNNIFCAPLLLVPIRLEQVSAVEPYFIKSAEEDVIVNPTFAYKMEAEYGVKLPDYDDEGLTVYLEKVAVLVKRLQWTVKAECKIGLFSFLKINMYRDLKDNAEKILLNRNVRQLMGEQTGAEETNGNNGRVMPTADLLIGLHNVVDADSSQIEAIEMAKTGKNFVLQGPPGTGKSQTITNIIAECLYDGKKVLFVSEKLAALNVVYDKLKRAGFADFCLQLHSHKANKKDIITDICHTLHMGKSAVSVKAGTEIAIKAKVQRQLDSYAMELHKQRPGIEKSLYQLFEIYAALRSAPDVEWSIPQLVSKGASYLTETTVLLEQYTDYIPSVGYDYKKNPWYGYVDQDTSYQAKNDVKNDFSVAVHFLRAMLPLLQDVSEKYAIQCDSIKKARVWSMFFNFVGSSRLITPALLNKKSFDEAAAALHELRSLSSELLDVHSMLSAKFDDDVYKLDGAAYLKKLTKLFGGLFSRFFNGEYRRIISELRLCKKDGKKPSYREAVAAMEQLADYQQKNEEYAEKEAPVKTFLGEAYTGVETDWDYAAGQMTELEKAFSDIVSFGTLKNLSDFSSEQESFATYVQNFKKVFTLCDDKIINRIANRFDKSILDVCSAPCSLVVERLDDCLREMDKLDNWRHFRNLLSKLNDKQVVPYIDAVIGQNVETDKIVAAFKKQFYYQWIDLILSETPVLSAFNRVAQDKAIQTFSEKDTEQFEINKVKIRAKLSAMRPSLDMIASGSALAVLLREGEKKRKQKSIRSLLIETGELVQRIKPCFLMSPLSVSTFLAPEAAYFDVIVFDEASQIFPQDAIGAIYRGKQLIVVGDSKQMPPSNFFNASIEVGDDEEEAGDVTDFESVLDLCSTSMRQLRLCWHYRSRYEQLIAFSNKNFYDGDLVTFPSAASDAQGIGVDYYHIDGIFDRKAHINRKEAEFVVDLIYQNIEKYPDRSLGVVAFSMAQQDLIDRLLAKRRQNTPEKEAFFKTDGAEPFFVKNLETVQGDERDTIIFSVAYGFDAQGRLLHNFGPLNRAGGERRLNVAVTRAKCNVQLVSSMHYTDIDLEKTSAEGVKLLREYLDYAENGEVALERAVTVNPFDQFDSDFEQEVCDFLRSEGFSVDTQVGCSGFRIDLGLKRPDSSDYVLAVECDGAAYHSARNARDRDRLRQEILERMGWKFYRVWSTDWFRNKNIEQQRLLEAANNALKNKTEEKLSNSPSPEMFEEEVNERISQFPSYKAADINQLRSRYRLDNFKEMVKDILEVEAPLSEELLLKRTVYFFEREKVTDVVRRAYERKMSGCRKYGIVRKNGFLYLENAKKVCFRKIGDLKRDVKQIAPEELAAGMLEIIKQNVSVDKKGLYQMLAAQCGTVRVGKVVSEAMDDALMLLTEQVVEEEGRISLK